MVPHPPNPPRAAKLGDVIDGRQQLREVYKCFIRVDFVDEYRLSSV